MVENKITTVAEELGRHLSPDFYASLVSQDFAKILQQVAEEVGLTFTSKVGNPGEKFTFISRVGVHHGEFEEGKVIVKITFGSYPEKMTQLWERVEEIKHEKSSNGSSSNIQL